MDAKKLKRAFVFSSAENKQFIEILLLRCAEAENRSVSSIIEDALIDYLTAKYPGSYPADKLLELRESKDQE